MGSFTTTDEAESVTAHEVINRNELTEFDEDLYRKLITRIVIYKNNTAKVVFLNGSSIKVEYQPRNHKITEKEQK